MASETETSGAALGGHEPSYYEIALTNRQVVFAFVILLVCLVAAFFSGVWVGTRGEEKAAAQRAQIAAEKADKVSPEGQSLEEFKFFAKPGEGPKDGKHPAGDSDSQEPANPKPAKETTLAEDVAKPSAPPAPPAAEERSAPREPERSTPPARQPEPKPAPPAKATTAAPPPPQPAPDRSEATVRPRTVPEAPAAAPAPTMRPGDVIIQVFSSADEDQADKVRDRLVKGGQKAFLSPIDKGGRTMYRVRIGPFSSRDSAEKVAEKVRKEQRLDTWVTTP